MPYQDRHPVDYTSEASPLPSRLADAEERPSGGRLIQIIIVLGLLAAILVAVFGQY